MAKKISQLGLAVNVTANDLFQVVDKEDTAMSPTGTNKRITAQTLGNYLPVTATGSSASRTLKDRFADTVNVKDFGAIGDGVTDDTSAIQAAINAGSGNAIHFPKGVYIVSSTLVVKKLYTSLICDSVGSAIIQPSSASIGTVIKIQSDLSPTYPDVFGVNIVNLSIIKPSSLNSTSICVGLFADRADALRLENVNIVGFPICLKINGGKNCYYNNLRLGAYGQSSTISNSSTVLIDSSTTTGNSTGFTHLFDNCIIGSDFVNETTVSILGNDYCAFSNCYISGAKLRQVLIQASGNADHLYDNWFDQCYFDGGEPYENNPTPLGIWIKENSPDTAPNKMHNFTSCMFGQMKSAFLIDENSTTQLGISNCRFTNIYEDAIYVKSNDADIRISGCSFRDCVSKTANSQIIQIDDISTIVISNNIFYFSFGITYPVNISAILFGSTATISSASITGNSFYSSSANITDFINQAASITHLAISGNSSNNPSSVVAGVGNTANANPYSLDWYEEKSFTPTITFGGNSTGITYSASTASSTRIGNRVFFTIYIQLTSKGSSVGIVEFGLLPYLHNSSFPCSYSVSCGNMNTTIGGSHIVSSPSATAYKINLKKLVGGLENSVNESDLTNTSYFNITGSYQA